MSRADTDYQRLLLVAAVPVTLEDAKKIWGDEDVDLTNDVTRSAFFRVWAMAQADYADAVIAELFDERGRSRR